MWSAEINLLGALYHGAAKCRWHGWTHSTSGGRSPIGHNVVTIGLSAVVKTAKTVLEIRLKCRYHQKYSIRDMGPEAAAKHWYEMVIEDAHCVFGRKVLIELYSEPEDPTYVIHKNAFEAARTTAKFCTHTDRRSKEGLAQEISDMISLALASKPIASAAV